MNERLKSEIRRYADAHADADGLAMTPIEGVAAFRSYAPTGLVHAIYKPALCLVLGGAKEIATAAGARVFEVGQSVIVSADIPIVARVVSATRAEPYLAFAIGLEMGLMREVAAQMPPETVETTSECEGVVMCEETDAALLDCALRLMRLIDHPDAVPVLRPAIVREMHYWLLAGRHGPAIRRMAAVDGHAERISRAVAVLREAFAQPVPVERLAAVAGMSLSSFHQHFKVLTSLSPRQFQKRLRLLEARRLMVSEGMGARQAAFEVGYESASQFTREYARMFGAPPRRDTLEARAA